MNKEKEVSEEKKRTKVIKNVLKKQNGQDKCPKCGSTDISPNKKTGKLHCNFCRFEFSGETVDGVEDDLKKLVNKNVSESLQNIPADVKDVLTFKCESCGAEVIIDTKEKLQARCHWCRNTLSINQVIENGAVPDMVLPFSVPKEEAELKINEFVNKRKMFAHPDFKQEFNSNNVMGVYLPYIVVDVNAHSKNDGLGEITTRTYTVGSGDNRRTVYDYDRYKVFREYDITIDNITVESNLDKLDKKSETKTTNIINSIMPFDVENSVAWNANYLRGYSSEKRDVNIDNLEILVETQAQDISRHAVNAHLKEYNRGVSWKIEEFSIKGEQWHSAYLPVWLYSYQENHQKGGNLHYVAVNARTKETMGSVPINKPKLLFISAIVEVIAVIISLLLIFFIDEGIFALGMVSGFIYYIYYYNKYRNKDARHTYERETKTEIFNMKKKDEFIKSYKGASSPQINNRNNTNIKGESIMINKLKEKD